jgi:hypothetical protein
MRGNVRDDGFYLYLCIALKPELKTNEKNGAGRAI